MEQNNNSDRDIIHIVVCDWDTKFESQKCVELLDKLTALKKQTDYPFNYSKTCIEYAMFFFITTTEADLAKNELMELLDYKVNEDALLNKDNIYTINMFPKYDPEKWRTDANGKYFDIDALQESLHMFVDDNGDEWMCNMMPQRIDDYVEISKLYKRDGLDELIACHEKYKKDFYNKCAGWCHGYSKERGFTLSDVIRLPTGFIEQNTASGKPNNRTVYCFDKCHDQLKVKLFDD